MEHTSDTDNTQRHTPVLLHEIVDSLVLKPGAVVVDCNLGDGGHSEVIIKKLNGNVTILGFDLDMEAIKRTKAYLGKSLDTQIAARLDDILIPINANFSQFKTEMEHSGIKHGQVDAILFDLGLSTYDLIGSDKGFTFRNNEPLQMTFGAADSYLFNAGDIVNGWSEEDIANVIFAYGEERAARKIARIIVEYREKKRKGMNQKSHDRAGAGIETSKELADLIADGLGNRKGNSKTHPATKTFQALRIAVNDELGHLRKALEESIDFLKPDGVMAIISYHSLEDRIVKQFTKQWIKDGIASEMTKKPIVPSEAELAANPRSRSAKLRMVRKI